MKTISKELTEAALVDGASLWTIYRKVILPLCRPALAALATLEFTFIYNDFFWALLLMKTGDKRPITSALNNLQGEFFTDNNLLAAVAFIVALPTIIVYLVLSEAVRPRPDARLDEGLDGPARPGSSPSAGAGQTASRTNSQARKSAHQAAAERSAPSDSPTCISSSPPRRPALARDQRVAVVGRPARDPVDRRRIEAAQAQPIGRRHGPVEREVVADHGARARRARRPSRPSGCRRPRTGCAGGRTGRAGTARGAPCRTRSARRPRPAPRRSRAVGSSS